MTSCPYFDNLKFDNFDAVVISTTISHLNYVQADFHVSNMVQTFLVF